MLYYAMLCYAMAGRRATESYAVPNAHIYAWGHYSICNSSILFRSLRCSMLHALKFAASDLPQGTLQAAAGPQQGEGAVVLLLEVQVPDTPDIHHAEMCAAHPPKKQCHPYPRTTPLLIQDQ